MDTIKKAIEEIEHLGTLERCSPLYTSKPIGHADLEFINGALTIASTMAPEAFLTALLRIESDLGRQRKVKWGEQKYRLRHRSYSRRERLQCGCE